MSDESLWHELENAPPPPVEPNVAEQSALNLDAAALFNQQTQEAMGLMAYAIERLGGALVIPKEDLGALFHIGFDLEFAQQTGGIRIYVFRSNDPKGENHEKS